MQIIDQFLDAIWVEQGLSANTLSAYGSDLNLFAKNLSGKALVEVTENDITAFLGKRFREGIGSRSAARIVSSLRRFYGYLLREGLILVDPTALIELPHVGRLCRPR